MKRTKISDERPATVRRLYEVFAHYPASAREMAACSCCVSEAEIAALFSEPLGQLSARSLGKYSRKAMTTWGEETEWKHFLPRLLEIAMETDGTGALGLDWVGNKFSYVDWLSWPEEEIRALRDFWRETVFLLAERGDWDFANDRIQELARLDETGEVGLEKWLADAPAEAILGLDDWAKQWNNLDSPLAKWMRRPEIADKLLERL